MTRQNRQRRRMHGAPAAAHRGGPDVRDAETLRFGHFEIDPTERSLRVRGEPVALGGRAFDLLLALAQRPERLVTKHELLDIVWPGLVVEEHNVATQIGTLRKLLGAQAIATVPGRGYRLAMRRVDSADGSALQPLQPVPAAARSQPARQPLSLPGRDDDLAALAGLLQRCGRVTVVGAGVCWIELLVTLDNAGPLRADLGASPEMAPHVPHGPAPARSAAPPVSPGCAERS